MEYHPSSGCPPVYQHYQKFCHPNVQVDPAQLSSQPWWPFKTHLDFLFAQFITDTSLSRTEVKRLLELVDMIKKEESEFTLQKYDDLEKVWTLASKFHVPVCFQYNLCSHILIYLFIVCET